MNDELKNTGYEDKNNKAIEIKNSAIALIIVGLLCLIIVLLVFFNVIDLHVTVSWKNICCSFMGIFSLFLIITGILSIKSFKVTLNLAKEEDKITEEIEKWYKINITRTKLDNFIQQNVPEYETLNEEELFFYRNSLIYKTLIDTFMNLDEKYAEHMAEVIYSDLYENDN